MPQQKTTVGAKVPRDRKDRLTEIAERRSSEGEQVTVSDLLRDAIADIIEVGTESELSKSVSDRSKSTPSGDFADRPNGQESEESGGVYKEESEVNLRKRNLTDSEPSDGHEGNDSETEADA